MEQFFPIINYIWHLGCYFAASMMAWKAFKNYRERDTVDFGHIVATILLLVLPTVLHLLANALGVQVGFDPHSVQSF